MDHRPANDGEHVAYLSEHVRDALIKEPDIGEIDLQVVVDADRVVVSGHVSTPERHEAISRVLAQLLPDHDARNETTVTVYPEPQGPAA